MEREVKVKIRLYVIPKSTSSPGHINTQITRTSESPCRLSSLRCSEGGSVSGSYDDITILGDSILRMTWYKGTKGGGR